MNIGIQLCAPIGFGAFRKGTRYYFVGDAAEHQIHLAWFNREPTEWRVYLITLKRVTFEEFLRSCPPKLKPLDIQLALPEWLTDDEGINFDALESERPGDPVRTIRKQAEARLFKLGDALEHEDEIISSADPISVLNQYAYSAGSAVHPYRLALWFFAFILHGRDLWALKKSRMGTGRWDRLDKKHENKKFGNNSADDGTCFNSPATPASDAIMKSYLKRCGLGVTMASIHLDALTEDFGCITIPDKCGNLTFSHPTGGPIFSYGQFRYHVVKRIGKAAVQATLYGATRVRRKSRVNKGNLTAQYSRLLEGFEVDAYYCSERPKAMFSDAPADRLAVARGTCGKSSYAAGVEFAIGAENGEAYRAMIFFSVAPRWYLEEIYGLPKGHLKDWYPLGMPPNFRSDRGPAGYRKLVDELQVRFPIKSVVPSYEPQSKALVESGHPRDVQPDGAPSFVLSDLNTPQLIKKEIYRALADNLSSDISARLTDQEIEDFEREGRHATPHHYAGYLLDRVATAGRQMSLEQAVRAFWTPIELTIDGDGVRYRHRHFISDSFTASGIQEKLGPLASMEVKGYCLSAVFLSLWVEINGKLIEVKPAPRSRQDSEDLLGSKAQIDAAAEKLKVLRSKTRTTAKAAQADARTKFTEATGKKWVSGRRVGGTPKRATGTVGHETTVMKGKSKVKKAA